MLARGVNEKIMDQGANYPFEEIQGLTGSADIAFCNLECAISERSARKFKNCNFCIRPEDAKGLGFAGFDVVSLANNHMFDCEKNGIISTIEFLKQEKIKFTGAGKTPAQALRPAIFDLKDTRIGFLAYNAYPMDWIHLKKDQPAIAFYDSGQAIEAIQKLSKKADVVIVSLHWGDEYHTKPNSRQIKIAHQLIDAGADLILGHHPHVLQPIEEYKSGVIVYSMGNFVFDQRKEATRKSVIFSAKLSKKGVEGFSTLPVQITDHRPCLLNEKAGKEEVAADLSTDETN